MTNTEWHGWARQREALHIGPLPGRKSICLYSMNYSDGAVMSVHAYFRSEDEARKALAVLDRLVDLAAALSR